MAVPAKASGYRLQASARVRPDVRSRKPGARRPEPGEACYTLSTIAGRRARGNSMPIVLIL